MLFKSVWLSQKQSNHVLRKKTCLSVVFTGEKENIEKQVNYCHVCHVLYCKDVTVTAKILNWVYNE
jgi:hypothetical protein